VAGSIADPVLRERVRERLAHVLDQSTFPLKARAPIVHALTPSRLLTSSTWRFRHSEIVAAQQLGHRDAKALP
jgi:hypothetical protein